MKRLGLFGGTFDPPHNGHLHIATAFANELNLENVIFIPAGNPYHKKHVLQTSAQQRLAMVERTITVDSRFAVSDIDVVRLGATHTFDTVTIFQKLFPHVQLWWLMGMDSLLTIHTWYRYENLLETVNLAIAMRPETSLFQLPLYLQHWLAVALDKMQQQPEGLDGGRVCLLQAEAVNINSTLLRAEWRTGHRNIVRAQIPASVADYIDQEQLYQA